MAKLSAFERSQQEIDTFISSLQQMQDATRTYFGNDAWNAGCAHSLLIRAFAGCPKQIRKQLTSIVSELGQEYQAKNTKPAC